MRYIVNFVAVTALLFALGCGGGETTDGAGTSGGDSICAAPADATEVIAEAGGFSVTQLEWEAELLTIPARARGRYDNEKGKKDIADRVLLNKALFAEAEKLGLLDDPKVIMSARLAAEKAFVAALLAQVEADAASDVAVQAYYDENKDRYSREEVRARHILVKDEALAKDIYAQLGAEGDFAALAREHSEDRGSKGKGGELPWATKDRWVPEFAEAAFSLEAGGRSEPIKSKFGWHIIETLEKRDMQPMEEVRPGIERILTRNAVRDFRDGVKKELGIGKPSMRPGANPRAKDEPKDEGKEEPKDEAGHEGHDHGDKE
jgi:peptidyl-prolyl cis-trans isomerase C